MPETILVIGACGQIGTELTMKLRDLYGPDNVIAGDIREGNETLMASGPFEQLDATDLKAIEEVVMHYEVDTVYLMAAMLSATAEKFPMRFTTCLRIARSTAARPIISWIRSRWNWLT